jgi:hypothetical protein
MLAAGKCYSRCARAVDARIKTTGQLTATDSERVIGLGIASDWTRRAAGLESTKFATRLMNGSRHAHNFQELMRFVFAWSGANALFARDAILTLLGTPSSKSELARFRVLFQTAMLTPQVVSAREKLLRNILSTPTVTRLPGVPFGTTTSTLFAINAKYVPLDAQTRGTGKLVAHAAISGHLATLDLPTLVYSFRNWSVHGNSIAGSFGSIPRFSAYASTLVETLADVHNGVAARLELVL